MKPGDLIRLQARIERAIDLYAAPLSLFKDGDRGTRNAVLKQVGALAPGETALVICVREMRDLEQFATITRVETCVLVGTQLGWMTDTTTERIGP